MKLNEIQERDQSPFYAGQRILVEVEFRLLGVPTDPLIVQVFASNPRNKSITTITYPSESLVRVGAGLYEAAILVDTPGQWHFRAEGAGIVDSVTETHLDVLASTI